MFKSSKPVIADVSDTALWVAVYRAEESLRPDALFRDPFASKLAGDRGRSIARKMMSSIYTGWSVVIRTRIIDSFIQKLISEGVDTVVNLGAGLDARPYRMDLPSNLKWIEVDYPKMIERKAEILKGEEPKCQLERISADLSDRKTRQDLFSKIARESKIVLILTEGVVPYLSDDEAALLAQDLHQHSNFRFWIVDYFSPRVIKYLRSKKRMRQMGKAWFKFGPLDWYSFFDQNGWVPLEKRFMAEESIKLGRPVPMPWWVKILRLVFDEKVNENFRQFSGYFILVPK